MDGHCRDREEQSEVLKKKWAGRKFFYTVTVWPPSKSRGGVRKPLLIILERKVKQFRDLGFSV